MDAAGVTQPMMSLELMSLLGGAVTGFVFRYMAARSEERKLQFERMMQAIDKADDSADRAAKRDMDGGVWTRRFIVASVIFAIVVAPFVMSLLGVPTFLEVPFQGNDSLLGLIQSKARTAFIEINGNLITTEIRQALIAITGFYFGSAAASNKS